jgi:glucosamine-6-phosphate deaminase
MNFIITDSYEEMSKLAAETLTEVVKEKSDAVVALPTGGTTVGTLKQLSEMYREGKADFSGMRCFNMDEYIALAKDNPQGYYFFLNDLFYKNVNIKIENTYVPDVFKGLKEACAEYEKLIKELGYFDYMLLGIGHDGHICFNMPSSVHSEACHVADLSQETINANSRYFDKIEDVPKQAITLGMGTVLKTKKIVLIANGLGKSEIMAKLYHATEVDPYFPASFLLLHPNVTIIVDEEAAKLF